MAIQGIPHPSVPVIDPKTGLMNPVWFQYFKARDGVKLTQLGDVTKLASPSNGNTVRWDSTNNRWNFGA